MTSTKTPMTGSRGASSTGSAAGGSETGARPSIGDLVSTLSEKLSQLVRDEIRLAKVELAEKGKHAATGVGLFVAAAVLASVGFMVLIATAILGMIEAGMDPWLAALIVGLVLVVIAIILALVGKKALEKGAPPVPAKSQASLKADVAALKEGLSS